MAHETLQGSSEAWLSDRPGFHGEFQLLDGVHLLRSDDRKLVACWYDGSETVELLDPASVGWPDLPIVVSRTQEHPSGGIGRLSDDGSALVWLDERDFLLNTFTLVDLRPARVLSHVGEGIRDWGPNHEKVRDGIKGWGPKYERELEWGGSQEVKGDGWAVARVAFSPNGRLLAIVRAGSPVIEIWTITGTSPRLLSTVAHKVPSPRNRDVVRFDSLGDYLIAGRYDALTAWKVDSGLPDTEMTKSLCRLRLVIRGNKLLAERDAKEDEPVGPPLEMKEVANDRFIRWRTDEGVARAWSPDGSLIATAEEHSKVIRIWSVATGNQVGAVESWKELYLTEWSEIGISFSPDGRRIALHPYYHLPVEIWDWQAPQWRQTLSGSEWGWFPTFSPDGSVIALGSGAAGGWMRACSVSTGRSLLYDGEFRPDNVRVAFSPDGSSLAAVDNWAGHGGKVRVWGAGGSR